MGSLEARVVALCDAVKLLSWPFYDFEYHVPHPACVRNTSRTPPNTTGLRPHPWSESRAVSFEPRLPILTAAGIGPSARVLRASSGELARAPVKFTVPRRTHARAGARIGLASTTATPPKKGDQTRIFRFVCEVPHRTHHPLRHGRCHAPSACVPIFVMCHTLRVPAGCRHMPAAAQGRALLTRPRSNCTAPPPWPPPSSHHKESRRKPKESRRSVNLFFSWRTRCACRALAEL